MQWTKSGWTTSTVQLGPRIYHFGKILYHHGGLIRGSIIPNPGMLMPHRKRTLSNVNTTITAAGNGARTTALMQTMSELAVMLGQHHQSLPHNPESAYWKLKCEREIPGLNWIQEQERQRWTSFFLKVSLICKGESKSERTASGEPFATIIPTNTIKWMSKLSMTEPLKSFADKWAIQQVD